jgi:hypothetical protein
MKELYLASCLYTPGVNVALQQTIENAFISITKPILGSQQVEHKNSHRRRNSRLGNSSQHGRLIIKFILETWVNDVNWCTVAEDSRQCRVLVNWCTVAEDRRQCRVLVNWCTVAEDSRQCRVLVNYKNFLHCNKNVRNNTQWNEEVLSLI